jgi:4'-phosphopantetheinyl transferase EntD
MHPQAALALVMEMQALFPPGVVVATSTVDGPTEPLLPAEEEAVRNAVAPRKQEFAVGRACARRALRRLGVDPRPIPVGSRREPMWPEGIVGSITHCPSFCAAAVASAADFVTIGIDAAVNERLDPSVQNLIVRTETERRWLGRSDSRVAWEVVLFSIKESVFKAWSPLDGRRLGFQDVQVSLHPEAAAFQADVLAPRPGPLSSVSGRFVVTADLVFSAVALPRPQP